MSIFSLCVVSSVALFLCVQWGSRRRKLPLPPGPPATPVLGHLLAIPSTKQEYYFYKLGKTYGDIIHLHIPGRSYIVLNSVHAAIDLLDKRSHNYSDRPALPVFEEMGWVWSLPFMPDGPQFQLHRRMFQQYFNRKEYATAIVLRTAFGYQLTSTKDVYLDIMRDVSHAMTTIGSPGGTPIECQTKAQEEIDAVIGSNRLPDFEDRESLPYVECLMQETLRCVFLCMLFGATPQILHPSKWNHAVPLGAPHRSLEDDTYNGMFIPKGSIIIANTRGMSLDENVYNDPLSFNPSRYLPKPIGNGEPYPVAHFGFGRRICPGRHLASPSLWIAIVSILATMHISKALDEDGKQITPETTFTPGGTSHPVPFKCSIRPRNETAQSLIERGDTLDNY